MCNHIQNHAKTVRPAVQTTIYLQATVLIRTMNILFRTKSNCVPFLHEKELFLAKRDILNLIGPPFKLTTVCLAQISSILILFSNAFKIKPKSG